MGTLKKSGMDGMQPNEQVTGHRGLLARPRGQAQQVLSAHGVNPHSRPDVGAAHDDAVNEEEGRSVHLLEAWSHSPQRPWSGRACSSRWPLFRHR